MLKQRFHSIISFTIFIQTTLMEDPKSAASRMKIFDWLQERVYTKGDVLSREELRKECIIAVRSSPFLARKGYSNLRLLITFFHYHKSIQNKERMRNLVKLILLMAFLLPSCSTSKVMKDDLVNIQNHWIHSYEEDLKNVKVFRPSDYDFKPSRGRAEMIIISGGELKIRPIPPNDEPITYSGNWKVEGANLELHYDNKTEVYKIFEISTNSLKLK